MPISSIVSRQSAVKPGQNTSARRTPASPNSRSVGAVYGCSHSALPKRDWNVTRHSVVDSPSAAISNAPVCWHWS